MSDDPQGRSPTDPGADDPAVFAADALARHGLADARCELLSISENATYRVTEADGTLSVLRVHRPGYHSRAGIESELAWIDALGAEGLVHTAPVLPAPDGERVVECTGPGGRVRHAVRFGLVAGREPAGDRLVDDFATLGALTARLHGHSRRWRRPPGFTRHVWDLETSIGPRGHWGRWQDGLGMTPAVRAQLQRAADLVTARLTAFGAGPERFGLVHADMRLANLLVVPGRPEVTVIDFDDCGLSWFLYDLGASLSFIEHEPYVPELVDAWVSGYRTVAPLSAAEQDELDTFIMLRRLLLVAWISSHRETATAQAMGTEYTHVSADLAESYLRRRSPGGARS